MLLHFFPLLNRFRKFECFSAKENVLFRKVMALALQVTILSAHVQHTPQEKGPENELREHRARDSQHVTGPAWEMQPLGK